MSTATPFNFLGAFPFCATDQSGYFGSLPYDFVGNLTLAQVMAFFWNLETFTITTGGSATNASGTTSAVGNLVLDPISSSDYYDFADVAEGVWFGSISFTAFSSFPAISQPRARVCNLYDPDHGFVSGINGANTSHGSTFVLGFAISTDPSNAGKYRIYYSFQLELGDTGTAAPLIAFCNPVRTGLPILAAGSFTIGGITMDWDCFSITPGTTSHSGLSLSATSSNFTYP